MRTSTDRADRRSRVAMVIVGLFLATAVAGVSIAARVDHGDGAQAKGRIIKGGGHPLSASGQPPVLW